MRKRCSIRDDAERPDHILAGVPSKLEQERFDTLVETPGLLLERIVSPPGHSMPVDEWFDQDRDEFVLVLQGRGALVLEGRPGEVVLNPGDFLKLPAGVRHRVAWTDAHSPTVWLALHYELAGT
ncbi:MAG: cupin domain-containing protein [Candidatus Latescibacteria bacterium]|jgi:cupin 2 domain-containing protein|nr:cupin [Gemmatimonadaceae bacterium]MDP6017733.1 cupin domain-containing protein [Candidatus Latescibacterota bacterium]MDP7448185.1 cupin domain-containing protein [Candidatus Latescibacterota bacterium]HJP34251.1 cupin domain-containing protein [Candidatus Latescibacterota bacterium]